MAISESSNKRENILLVMMCIFVHWRFPFRVNIRRQVGDLHMNCLILLVFWWNGTDTIGDFVARLRNVFALNTATKVNYQ